MLPENFAEGEPRLFDLTTEWSELRDRYAPLGPSDTLDWVFRHVSEQGADVALLEHEYIDADYRDEYAHFYIKVFQNVPDRCERLHFWSAHRYLGYCSIRPIRGQPVCRTMLDPGQEFETAVSCVVKAKAHPYGRSLRVPAFPFISQDRQYGRCAHAVLWMVSHYHHVLNDTPARTMSDIVDAAAEDETERVVPSRGLTEQQIGATLRRIGLPAAKYSVFNEKNEQLLDARAVQTLAVRYLNSRIPLVLGTPWHLTALIGARHSSAGGPLEFIRCDDERGAYCPQPLDLSLESEERWNVMFVPLPGRIYLLGEDVELRARRTLRWLTERVEFRRDVFDGRTVRFREYVVDSRVYKAGLRNRGLPQSAADAHVQVGCPRWIWVVEVQDKQLAEAGEPSCLGEIAVDSTSDARHPHYLFANLPGLRAAWPPHNRDPVVVNDPINGGPAYDTGTALGL